MATGDVFQIISCCGNQKSIPSSAFQSDTIMASEMTSNEAPEVKTEVELLYEEIHRIFPTYDRRNADFYFTLFTKKGLQEEAEKYVDDVIALHAGDNVSVAIHDKYKGNLNAAELLYKHGAEIRIGHYNVHLCNSTRGVDIFMKYMNSNKLNEYLTEIDVYGRVCNGSYLFIMGHSLETIKHIIEKYPHVLKYSNVFCTDETKKHTPQAKTYEVFEELVKFYGTEMLYEYNHKGRQLSDYGARWVQDHVTFTDVKGPTGCTGTVTLTDAKGITGDTLEDTDDEVQNTNTNVQNTAPLDQGKAQNRLDEITDELHSVRLRYARAAQNLKNQKSLMRRLESNIVRLEERKAETDAKLTPLIEELKQTAQCVSSIEANLLDNKNIQDALNTEYDTIQTALQSAAKVE
jgi:archaellum component FlaC